MNLIEEIKMLFSHYLNKYETACVFREHDKAMMYHGTLNGLEHLLLQNKEGEWLHAQRQEMEDRRNKLVALWRELTK